VPGGAVLQWFGVNDSNYRIYQDKAPTSSSANFGLNFNLDASSGDLLIAGTLTENSDISLKDNIVDVDNALTKVAGLRGRYFTRNDIADDDKRHVGIIAQEIESVLPEVVHTNEETNLKSVSYTSLVPILIEAIKELKAKVEALES
jgi:hypothetical protein